MSEPVLDQDTGPFRHVVWLVGGTLFGLHQFPDTETRCRSLSAAPAWTTSRSECRTAQSWRCGKSASISSRSSRRDQGRGLRIGTVLPGS